MKTAEVAIEHVLTGVLALCAFLLPLLSGLDLKATTWPSEAFVGVLGMAYLFGVVFDRIADTILSPIEDWLRLRLAHKKFKKRRGNDPFPQDLLEYSLRDGKEGRIDWIDSLRSRIRTCRGLAVLGLPAAMGVAIYLPVDVSHISWNWDPHGFVAVNLFLMFIAVVVSSLSFKQVSALQILQPVRTDELSTADDIREDQVNRAKKRMLILSSFYFLMLLNSLITIARLAPLPEEVSASVIILLSAALVTALPLWVWYRITTTHLRFIYLKLRELESEEASDFAICKDDKLPEVKA